MKLLSLNVNAFKGAENFRKKDTDAEQKFKDYINTEKPDYVCIYECKYKEFPIDGYSKLQFQRIEEKMISFRTALLLPEDSVETIDKQEVDIEKWNKVYGFKSKEALILAVHIPDDPKMWEDVIRWVEDNKESETLVVGDFNAYEKYLPKLYVLKEKADLVDLWTEWNEHPLNQKVDVDQDGKPITYKRKYKRTCIDYALVTEEFARKVTSYRIDQSTFSFTDHAALIVEWEDK